MANIIKVYAMPTWPYVYRVQDFPHEQRNHYEIDGWTGLGVDILYDIGQKVDKNMTFSISKPPDEQWGELLPNNSWNGIMGALLEGEIRIGLALFDLNADRLPFVQALRLPTLDSKTIWIHESNLIRPARQMWTLVRILSWKMWLAALVSVIATIFLIKSFRLLLKHQGESLSSMDVFGALFGQSNISSTYMSERTLFSSLMLTMMLCLLIFSTALMAEFTWDRQQLPFTTSLEMWQQGYRLVAVAEALSDMRLFQESSNQWERLLYENRPSEQEFYLNASFFHGAFKDFEGPAAYNHIMKIPGHKFGLVLGQTEMTDKHTGCNHPWIPAIVEAYVNPKAILIFRHDDFDLFEKFQFYHHHWLQHGLIRAGADRAMYGSENEVVTRCSNPYYLRQRWDSKMKSLSTDQHHRLDLQTFQSPLLLIGLGFAVASISFLGELLLTLWRKNHSKRKKIVSREIRKRAPRWN